jgi:hypothetical protein
MISLNELLLSSKELLRALIPWKRNMFNRVIELKISSIELKISSNHLHRALNQFMRALIVGN